MSEELKVRDECWDLVFRGHSAHIVGLESLRNHRVLAETALTQFDQRGFDSSQCDFCKRFLRQIIEICEEENLRGAIEIYGSVNITLKDAIEYFINKSQGARIFQENNPI